MDNFQNKNTFKVVIENSNPTTLESRDNKSFSSAKSGSDTTIIHKEISTDNTTPASAKKTSGINWGLWLNNIALVVSVIFIIAVICNTYMPKYRLTDEVKEHTADLSVCYHYKQLDDYGKEIYNAFLDQAYRGTEQFTVKGISKEEFKENYENQIDDAVYAFVYDHPEFFWFNRGYSYSHSGKALKITVGTRKFWSLTSKKDELISAYFNRIDYIVACASQYDSDYEKIRYVHDYLADSIVYNFEAAEDNDDGNWSVESDYAYSGYGGIVNGSCVCAGYSSAFQVIIQRLGYECAYVTGDTTEGYHAWNIVNIDGEYYWFDLTWNDIEHWEREQDIRYNYFATTDEVLFEEHTPEKFEYPECDCEKYIQIIKDDSGYFT